MIENELWQKKKRRERKKRSVHRYRKKCVYAMCIWLWIDEQRPSIAWSFYSPVQLVCHRKKERERHTHSKNEIRWIEMEKSVRSEISSFTSDSNDTELMMGDFYAVPRRQCDHFIYYSRSFLLDWMRLKRKWKLSSSHRWHSMIPHTYNGSNSQSIDNEEFRRQNGLYLEMGHTETHTEKEYATNSIFSGCRAMVCCVHVQCAPHIHSDRNGKYP